MDAIHSQAAVRDVLEAEELPDPVFTFVGPKVPGGKFVGTFQQAWEAGCDLGCLLAVAITCVKPGVPYQIASDLQVTMRL